MDLERLVASVALALAAVIYTVVGRQGWRCLAAAASTSEQMAFIVGAQGASVWMRLGRYAMVGTWPLWFGPVLLRAVCTPSGES